MVRIAAFAALLAEETGQTDVVIGTYVSNRDRLALQDMLGFFANLVPLRFRRDPAKSFREWLSVVRATMMEVSSRSEIPYEQLCSELRKSNVTPPEITVIFNTPNIRDALSFASLEATTLPRYIEGMPWGFRVNLDDRNEESGCTVNFDANRYDPEGVRRFIERFKRLLDHVSREPDLTVARLLAKSMDRGRWLRSIGRTLSRANPVRQLIKT